MRLRFSVICLSVVLCVVALILAVIPQYFTRKTIEYSPVFEDLIATDLNNNNKALSYSINTVDDRENVILRNLNAVLEARPFDVDGYVERGSSRRRDGGQTPNTEIMHIINAAIGLKLAGKSQKALKLLEHAFLMAPNNPDVLNWYGEFLEQFRHDVVTADELYFKALIVSPNHQAARTNHDRTSPVVDKLDLELFYNIDRKKDYLKEKFDLYNLESLKKQAYYLHIYHTVGIEGNTMSVDQLKRLLETGQVQYGKSIQEHNEVLGLQLAMKYVKTISRNSYISVDDILQMHKRVMGHVDPLMAGAVREEKVYVGSHVPPEFSDIPYLMRAYVNWLNSNEAKSMHPVRYAALAHYKLVDIHPFLDGNGRTSRLIMNLILLRGGYPPIMILKEQRERYYDSLNVANQGDVRPFVRFIAHCTLQILDMYIYGTNMLTDNDYNGINKDITHHVIDKL